MGSEYVTVLVPAAGLGTRIGGTPKQFRIIGGESVLFHTLEALRSCAEVNAVVVALPSNTDLSGLEEALNVTAVIHGGDSRRASVINALSTIPESTEIVLIHDAVRPFVTPQQVSDVISAVRTEGAAALAVPAVDTMRYGAEGFFGKTVSRRGLYRMQTPQGFRRSVLEEALLMAGTEDTDEVTCVQAIGHPVAIVPGSAENYKITHSEDWERMLKLWTIRGGCA